jgi:hypothetical protein
MMADDCMQLDRLVLQYDEFGKCVAAWFTYVNREHECCGREPIFPRTW